MSTTTDLPGGQDFAQIMLAEDWSLLEASLERRVLVVFLRHFGCKFCQEALEDLSNLKPKLDSSNILLVLIHMEPKATSDNHLEKWGLTDVIALSDPTRYWYQRFGLEGGAKSTLSGFRNMVRSVQKSIDVSKFGYGVSAQIDVKQMPGVFVIEGGEVSGSYYHKSFSDRPDYRLLLAI